MSKMASIRANIADPTNAIYFSWRGPTIAAIVVGLTLTLPTPLHAHRIEGLLQSSLVEVLPSHVGVEGQNLRIIFFFLPR